MTAQPAVADRDCRPIVGSDWSRGSSTASISRPWRPPPRSTGSPSSRVGVARTCAQGSHRRAGTASSGPQCVAMLEVERPGSADT